MHPRLRDTALLTLAGTLAACAGPPPGDYPSLAIRDVERAAGQIEAPQVLQPTTEPARPATLENIDRMHEDAAAAHARFLDAAPATRRTVQSAAGAAVGSERWAQAQVALAGLEAIRSQAMIALADLDRVYVDSSTDMLPTSEVAARRDAVIAMVADEDREIDSLQDLIRS